MSDGQKLGCAGWVAAVLTFSWLLSYLLSDDAAIIGGVVLASLLAAGIQFRHGWRQEMDRQGIEREPGAFKEFAQGFWNGMRGR